MATVAKGDVNVEFVIVKRRESRLEWAFCDDDAGGWHASSEVNRARAPGARYIPVPEYRLYVAAKSERAREVS
jgi:hypothetical protein